MADNGLILTEAGQNLLAQALTGKTLTFTRAFIGDGILSANSNPAKRTSLISPKMELPIQSITKTQQIGTCEVVLELSNKNLATGFFVNEYGIFARINNGAENLYAYRNTGANLQFLPGDNGVDLIHYSLSLITVISQAQNVTAIINSQNNYVTVPVLDGRMLSLFSGKNSLRGFWTYSVDGEKILRPQSLDDVKQAILGTGNVTEMISRIERLEDNLAQTLLALEMQELFPGYSHYIIEDFKNVNQLDLFECKITSIVAGDDSIDCDPIEGIIPGSWYMVSDNNKSELVQVHSVSVENGIQRIILENAIRNTYTLANTKLYRTSCSISNNIAIGPGIKQNLSWSPNVNWQGVRDNSRGEIALNSNTSNSKAFTFNGDVALNSEGFITLAA